jgi:ribosomal protein S18 acetylase RimI-like enzyme
MGSGYTSEDHERFTHEPLETAAGRRRYRLVVVRRLGRRVSRFMDTVPDGDFYVRAIAVDESHRGVGIGSTLLESLEQTALKSGSKRLTLDVYAKNRGARRLYERFGMFAESESRKWFGIPDTNLIRMVKPL